MQRVAARADEPAGAWTSWPPAAEAVAALKQEIEALRSAGDAPPPAEDPHARAAAADDEPIAEAEAVAGRGRTRRRPPSPRARACSPSRWPSTAVRATRPAAYLRENFELADPDALLDEVYARAEACK